MWVSSLKAFGFRNLAGVADAEDISSPGSDLAVEFDSGVNVLKGLNAQGKTNLVEAVYFCATAHSHRTNATCEMIRFDSEFARIQAIVAKDSTSDYYNKINILLRQIGKNKASKAAAINGVAINKLEDLLGVLYCVIFSPEDLRLIKAGPAERRRFVDMELCQINRVYYHELRQYYRILKQRNVLLKNLQKSLYKGAVQKDGLHETLDLWDIQLAESGTRLTRIRGAYIDELNVLADKIHKNLCGETLQAVYRPSCRISAQDGDRDEFLDRIKKNRAKDIQNGITTAGIHKDDVSFLLNGLDSRIYGSQGQQRTTALSLKLAEMELIKREKGENPVLLLDDVLSELDSKRQEQLLSSIEDIQTIITCTTAENLPSFSNAAMYMVHDGGISRSS